MQRCFFNETMIHGPWTCKNEDGWYSHWTSTLRAVVSEPSLDSSVRPFITFCWVRKLHTPRGQSRRHNWGVQEPYSTVESFLYRDQFKNQFEGTVFEASHSSKNATQTTETTFTMQLPRQTNLISGVIGGVTIFVALAAVRCIDIKDKEDKSALFKAVEHGNLTMVKVLLALGANPNTVVSS